MYICKNCGKEFYKKYSRWSNGDFCCKKCARSYSTKLKRKEINKKVSIINSSEAKLKYQNNPKICPICNKIIPYEKRKRKTCSCECGQKLAVLNNSYKNCGGYRKGSSRSKHGYYKGIWCDSTYELAYLIYCLDNNINIMRCKETFEYEFNGKKHNYHPDFIVNDELIEIKGYYTPLVEIKHLNITRMYKILYKDDLQEIFEYISKTYNKKYRKGWNNFYELYDDYKPKYEYICSECGNKFTRERLIKTETKFCCRSCSCRYNQRLLYKRN